MSPCDYSKYPPNWKSEIVPRILKRAKNKCEVCGLKNKQTVYSVALYLRHKDRYSYRSIWISNKTDADRISHLGQINKVRVVLTIAHLDHDEENLDIKDERLKAMCQYCHLNYDAKEKMRRIMSKSEQGELKI